MITLEQHHEWMIGFDLYCSGQMPDACCNAEQTKGYRAAHRGRIYAEVSETEVAQGNAENADRIAKAMTVREMEAEAWRDEEQYLNLVGTPGGL